ncbi:DUF3563 domain-containing protein [Alphaproteobacteria bacterium]|nr:DUF3563 domain-containing protein [Alphaproteobacteria bacterium]MDB4234243.1 DUF3563 domain-containing protein [Alphaproteobacteria bacterium]
MTPIIKYFQKVLEAKKNELSFEEKYLSKSVDLYDLERRQRELDNKNATNFNFRLK